jgi:hypothetical protein
MSYGASFGIGGNSGLYAGSGAGAMKTGAVFNSPITPDLTSVNQSPLQHPSSWWLVGSAVVMAWVYLHWHTY